jgi:hypothetical protein
MNSRSEEHRYAQRRVLIGLGVVAVLAGGGVAARRFFVQPKIVEKPDVVLNGSVSCSGDAIQVTNNDRAAWMDARVEINSKYARIVSSVPVGETVTIRTAQLLDSSNKPFDSLSMKCESADIQAYMRGARGHFQTANLQ